MPDTHSEPRSQLGLYRAHLTSPEHRRHITVGREEMLADTLEVFRKNIGRKASHHQLFIAPRGSGKTHFLSLIEDAIQEDDALGKAYAVVRFPEEARRILSFADFLLMICEILRDNSPSDSDWGTLYERVMEEDNDVVLIDTLVPAIRKHYKKTGQVLVLMVENLNQLMEEQMKKAQSVQALRGFLMQDNGCLLIASSPLHFGALIKENQPFYDFFDTQVLDPLSSDDSIELIRRNLEWDKRQDLLDQFSTLLPRLRAIYTLTGGSPRLTVMLYELISTESITAVKQQFLLLLDRITPFYQDRLGDLSPQERAVLETIASMRSQWGREAPLKTPGNIAKLMRMKQAQVSSLLARLTKALYLTASPNPADGRSMLYVIREGFFDLWLAMNISRAARQRIPLLTDFFASYYEKEEARRKKREEYWKRLEAGDFDEDAAENLNYLSEVGTPEEKAAEKIKLAATLTKVGETERPELLKGELKLLPLDITGRWISDHLDEPHDYLDDLNDLIQCWETQRQGGLEAFSQRLHQMGKELNYKSWSKLRLEFLRDHLKRIPLSEERVITRLNLVVFLIKLAHWKDAETQSLEALGEAEELNDKTLISWACNEYAQVLTAVSRQSEAEVLMRRTLAIDQEMWGKDDPRTSTGLSNLAALLHETGRVEEAESLVRQALLIDEESLGSEHPNVAIRLNNLAQLMSDSGRYEEAEPLMRRALEITEAKLGSDDPSVSIRLNNLAVLMQDTGRIAEAETLMHRALVLTEASLGDDHPLIALRLNNLAHMLEITGRLMEAQPMRDRALRIIVASLGATHPKTRVAVDGFFDLLVALGKTEQEAKEKVNCILK